MGKDNSLDKFVEKYPTYIEALDIIDDLKKQLEEKEKIIQMQQNIERYDIGEMLTENTKLRQQLKSQPKEIVEKIRRELGLKLKYKLNDEVYVLKICNQINEVLDTILKDYQK